MVSRQIEENANNALGSLLGGMLPACAVRAENTRLIVDNSGLRLDILVTALDRAPVVVEAEFMPAASVEREARERLGLEVADGRKSIEAAIALRYPAGLEFSEAMSEAVSGARLEYAVFYKDGTRFPESGWLSGSVEDVAELARLASVPQEAVNSAADALQSGIEGAVAVMDEMAMLRPAAAHAIADLLGMSDVPQTRRMACAIIANAMVFHDRVAGIHEGVKPLDMVCGAGVADPKSETISAWNHILTINYWPIFAIARDVITQIPSREAARMLERLRRTAGEVESSGASVAHDLTGRIFQRLIADRKYLATFYTLPASAALLARLAVAKMGVDWSDADAIAGLRIGDFACGTGALLSAVYERIAAMHENAGGDAAALHTAMMEEILYGCDVMPSAIHITGSTLSGMQPNVGFGQSRLYTMPYGRQEDGSVKIGSLELLQSSSAMTLFNTSDPALRTGSAGEETAAQVLVDVPDEGFDLVIMNPPFTSNTKHYDADSGVLNAAFAAYESERADQSDMAASLRRIARDSAYHGHAGMGSAFAALADRKIRPNGVIAFVLPFTAITGSSWAKFRQMIAERYADATVVSIAANGRDMSFSSDTGMAECLVIARKLGKGEKSSRGKFASLSDRPSGFVHAQELAKSIVNDVTARRLEDGPYGGIPIYSGDEQYGESVDAPLDGHKTGWGAARIMDASVAQVAHSLSNGKLWLPAEPEAIDLQMARLSEVGKLGIHDSMFTLKTHNGPFTKIQPSRTATYPSIWNHNAKAEIFMVCNPDSALQVKPGMEKRAAELWKTVSRAHLNRDFTFGSQPLAVAFTDQESAGGRVWPNVSFADKRIDYAFTIWGNSTLGLLMYWWHSSRQQSSKASMTRLSAPSLPMLDFRALTDAQLATAEDIFDEFRRKEFKPAYIADADPSRALLDKRVVCDLLGFGEDVYEAVRRLSAKWCAEPSVHGGKRRPRGAGLVV